MLKYVLIFFSSYFTVQLKAQHFFDTTYAIPGKILRYGINDKIKNCWIQYQFYYNGEISSIKQFDTVGYSKNYTFTGYNINKTIAFRFIYKNDKINGKFEEHFHNGNMKREGTYYNSFKVGDWKEYHMNGNLSFEYSFQISKNDSIFNGDIFKGKREQIEWGVPDSTLGEALYYYNINKLSFLYFPSSPSGIWKRYTEEGILLSKTNYNNKSNRKKYLLMNNNQE